MLVNVSGIGAKTALAILNRGALQVEQAVTTADVNFFTFVPRLGRKNAQKIIIELKGKLGSLADLDLSGSDGGSSSQVAEALQTMGYTKIEIAAALRDIPASEETIEQKLRFVLRHFGKKNS